VTGSLSRFSLLSSERFGSVDARVVQHSLRRSLRLVTTGTRRLGLTLSLVLALGLSMSSQTVAAQSKPFMPRSSLWVSTPPDWTTDGPCEALTVETETVEQWAACKSQHDLGQLRREAVGLLWLLAVCSVASVTFVLLKQR
jgi:hypothetical protein